MVFIKPTRLLALCLAAPLLLTGCQLSYIIKSGVEQGRILSKREKLESVLKKDSVSESVKRKLRLAQEAKFFAEQKLGLAATQNYSSYVDLGRPYVSWIVQAAKAYELSPHHWRFPLVGALPYKGFFSEEEAHEEAKKFDPAEYDTHVRGVTAYSTLGWFKDPILNTMMNYSDSDLVELIIHESVHATLYIKSQAEFNERLATYIGQLGAQKFFIEKEGAESATVKKVKLERYDQELFSKFLSDEIKELEAWYLKNKGQVTDEIKKVRLAEIQARFKADILPTLKTQMFAKALGGELNNAILVGYKTYQTDLTDFEQLYDRLGQDLPALLAFCKNLEKEKDPSQALKDFLNSSDSAGASAVWFQKPIRNKG